MIRRLLLAAAAVLIVALAIAAGALYWLLAGDASRQAIERQVSAWLGRPVRITDATVALYPRLALRLEDVRIGDPVRVVLPRVDIAGPLRELLERRFDAAPLDFSFRAVAGDTSIDAAGTIRIAPRVEGTVTARSENLAAEDLVELVAALTPDSLATPSDPAAATRVTAQVDAPAGTIAGVAFTRLAATVHTIGSDVSIEPLTFDIFGGRHNGWFDLTAGEPLAVRLGASVTNIDAAQLAAFGGAPGAVTGRLSASARLGGSGSDLTAVLGSLRGAGEVLVENGTLRGLDLVQTVVRFLGRADAAAQGTGTAFERLAGNFAFGDARVRSDDLTLHSSDFDIFARGTLRLDTDVLDGRADVVVSEALSAQAGTEIYRYARSGNRLVLPATVSGTLARPQVRFDAGSAVRRAIGNEIERRLTDLLDLVKRR